MSFSDLLKKSNSTSNNESVASYSLDNTIIYDDNMVTNNMLSLDTDNTVTTYTNTEEETYTRSDNYLWYDDYSDNNISYIDDQKNISVDQSQINVTQETNSQYIPFEMPRYYDGFDLVRGTILVHFVNKNGYEDFATPINVSYSDKHIRFGWLLDKKATAVSGDVLFEINVTGVNSRGDEYTYKTRPNGKLNIEKSLEGDGVIVPDSSWLTSFMTQITEKVSEAQTAAQEAKNAVSEVEAQAQLAANSAQEAQNVVNTAKIELEASVQSAVNTKVDTALENYYTKSETDENINIATTSLDTSLRELITTTLLNYYTKKEVDQIIESIDISDQLTGLEQEIADTNTRIDNIDGLAKFKVEYDGSTMTFYNGETIIKEISINSDPSIEWTTAYDSKVDSKIENAITPLQTELTEYKTSTNADLQSIHSEIDGLPQTLQNDYYTKTDINGLLETKADDSDISNINSTISKLEDSVNTNKSNIGTASSKLIELEDAINSIDKSPRLTYDMTYDETYTLSLIEIEGEGTADEVRSTKAAYVIQGGSGGGGTSSVLKIEYITSTPIVATTNDKVVIKYNFSGTDSSGDIVPEGSATWKVAGTIVATNTAVSGENSFDVTDYLTIGSQKVTLSITDEAGSIVTKSWTVQKIDVRLESAFNDRLTYSLGSVSFSYTPYGAVSKDVHFILDKKEIGKVTTSASGIPMAYELPEQMHGSHLLEVYITATINNNTIESNHITKDIIWYDENSSIPVIGCVQQEFTARQYDTTNIVYTVYDPNTENPEVILAVDDVVVSTLTLDNNTQTWQYKSIDVGEHVLTITCRNTVKRLKVTIEKLNIDVTPITAGLAFDFNPVGKSNNDVDRLWTDGNTSMTVSDNFDWVNGGYQIDENGDQYFCIKAGTSAVIDYKLFEDDAKRNGKELKLIFKTSNVRKSNATFLTCIDGDTAKIGFQMNVHEAYIYASAGSLYLPYSEEDIIEFEFNINKNTDEIPMVMGYEDGVATRPMIYSDSHDFTQINPKYITIGSNDCDVYIYRFKVYNAALTDSGILSNFIADARTADEMIDRYNRNQIYDENNQLTPEILAEKCPQLRIIKLEAPYFTNNKSDKVTGSTIQMIYKNGDPILDNWIAYNCMHSGQGTTSNEYGAAGRNLDLIMNKSGVDGLTPYIVLGDGKEVEKISLTRNSVEVNYLNVKVNIASSENANNALLQKRYNTYNPYTRPIKVTDPKVKDTMEFFNCVVFIKESNTDLSTHREFNDNEWHFYAIGNVGDSKKTDKTRVNDPKDVKECIVEIMDNTLPNSTFPKGDEALANLEKDQFDEEMTYGFRYTCSDATEEDIEACKEAWRTFYKFVVNSTDEEFKANLKDYFVVDSALYFYLFTLRYTMIDNRSKNTFWHYGKCDDGIYRWDLCFDYDNDTGLGINNSGELTMTYGYEDTDYKTKGDASTGYAFNAAESTFFCRIRDLMNDELCSMFVNRESANAWSANGLINQFDEWQSQFPEELWRLDIERKYLRTYKNGVPRFLTTMMQGRKKYQRRQFERDQEKYMATKFFGNVAVNDQIMFRCNTPTENVIIKPNYTLHLTPYSDMYLSVMFGATYRTQIRAEAGKEYDIECPFATMDDTAVLIYCASQIQAIGDLSACYIHDNDFSKGTKLQSLIIGNSTEGYQNTFLEKFGIGNNTLLEVLDIQNTPNLAQALDVSGCANLRELYAHGSGLTGITFANGGKIQIAELPAITSMSMKNLVYLTGLDISDYNNITTLIIENCPTVDVKNIFELAPNINRVRITGIDWTLDDTTLLDKIYKMYGIDKNGYNVIQSVLAGHVHVPVMREKLLADYNEAWSDLEITYNTLVQQFTATFYNADGTILDIQYIDKGNRPVDPITRTDNPISVPTLASTISTDYTYKGWDSELIPAFENLVFHATYTETTRKYTVRFLSMGNVLQETTGEYGTTVFYTGDIPTYVAEEAAYKYYLFDRWDRSGLVTGNKDINAIYDSCEYNSGYFEGKDISTMRPVEIYAMCKLGLESNYVEDKDSITISFGTDYNYNDVEQYEIISEKTRFDGTNYIDSGINVIEEDRDFVVAVDYKMSSNIAASGVLMQCFQSDGSNGFRLWNNNGVKITWGTSSTSAGSKDAREMIVLRHVKGEQGLHVYHSNLSGTDINYTNLELTKDPIGTSTLVFGCSKADDGYYENYGIGEINWAKVWYADLGDAACRELALWTHETLKLEMYGFRNYYLSDGSGKRCSMSFLAAHLLDRQMRMNNSDVNTGGWAVTSLNKYMNDRMYRAINPAWRQLIKKVKITSSIGNKSTDTSISDCYLTVPSLITVMPSENGDPYVNEGKPASFMTTNETRIRSFDGGDANSYWTRSPNASYTTYFCTINETGTSYKFVYPNAECGVLLELSI